MVNLILKFVSCSRAAGLRISSSEVLDCLNQLKLVDILDEPQFAAVLRANFAKSRREQFHFNRMFKKAMGEPVYKFIRRLRLEKSAEKEINSYKWLKRQSS